jgi:plastocyanin
VLTRRQFVLAGGLGLAGLGRPRGAVSAPVVEIRMRSDPLGAEVWFDPVGVRVLPGQTVRWIVAANVHTTTAYHPKNDLHSLRIPVGAAPWDSGFLVNPGDHFEVTLTAEGVYDYFCRPHEDAGMVGRIVVGRPGGPGALPFDYFRGRPGTAGWKPVPKAARRAFPSVALILARGRVGRPATGHELR